MNNLQFDKQVIQNFNFQINNHKSKQTQLTIMGGQNAKQIQGESLVQIDHPKFENAKVVQENGKIKVITEMNINEQDYDKWSEELWTLKSEPEYLLVPLSHQFTTKGFCGSTGTLTVSFAYYPYLLMQEIENRKKRKSKFQQCELWFLLFSVSAAQMEMKRLFDSKLGDVRPQNIFINQDGQIRLSCLRSFPKETTNFQKTFDNQPTLISPQDIKKLQSGNMDDIKNYQSEMFSIGMTILSAAMLWDFGDIYDLKKLRFKQNIARDYLAQWRQNNIYSQIFTAFVSNLCSFEPSKRLTQKQLWSWIHKYEDQIKNKDDFFIQNAPLKIDKEIQEMRGIGQKNIIQQQYLPYQQLQPQNVNYQQQTAAYPFIYDQKFISHQQEQQFPNTKTPPNRLTTVIIPSRQNPHQLDTSKKLPQSLKHIVPSTESMYTPISTNLYEQRFTNLQGQERISQLPPGVLPDRGIQGFRMPNSLQNAQLRPPSSTQQYQSSTMAPPTGGNYVYTRRIINPTSGSIVAQQRIGEEQYQRGISHSEEPQDADY